MFKTVDWNKAWAAQAEIWCVCMLAELLLSDRPLFPLDGHDWYKLFDRAFFVAFFGLYGYIKARREMVPVLREQKA